MKPRERQAWLIAASLFVSLFFLWGSYSTATVFVGALLNAFGWSHARVSLIPGAIALALGCSGPIAGWLLDRFEGHIVMGGGAALVGVGYIAASRASTFTELLVANLIVGVGLGASSWMPATVVIANWFGERRGTALGLATAGMESGGMVMVFLTGYVISQFGWRAAYLTLALPVLIIIVPLLVIVVRTRPGESVDLTLAESSQALPGYEIGEAIRYRVFWALVIVQLAWGLSIAGMFFHIVAYLMNLGSSLRFATTVVGVLLGLFAIGKPTMGALGDRIGGKNALGIALFLLSASIIVLLRAAGEWLIVPYFVFGVSAAVPAALVPLVLSNTLGLKRLGTLYGWLQVAVTVGFFVGPLIVGRLFDLTHSYITGFEIAALIAAIGSGAAFLCTAPSSVTLAEIVQPQKSTI